MPRRRTGKAGDGVGHNFPTPGIPTSSWSKVYGLGLMLLLLLFFLFVFRGTVPRAVDKAFAAVPPDPALVEKRHEELKALQGGAWFDPPDGTDFKETPGYHRLLQMLLDQHGRPGDAIEHPPEFDWDQALKTPDLQRAQLVRVRGYVERLWAQKLDRPVFEQTDVWRVVLENRGENGMVVDVMEQPPKLETRRDLVQVDAYFYRLIRYENPQSKMVEMPYLLARSLKIVPEEARPTLGASLADPANIVLLAAGAAIFGWLAFRLIRSRSQRPTVRWRAPHLHSSSVPHSPEG